MAQNGARRIASSRIAFQREPRPFTRSVRQDACDNSGGCKSSQMRSSDPKLHCGALKKLHHKTCTCASRDRYRTGMLASNVSAGPPFTALGVVGNIDPQFSHRRCRRWLLFARVALALPADSLEAQLLHLSARLSLRTRSCRPQSRQIRNRGVPLAWLIAAANAF